MGGTRAEKPDIMHSVASGIVRGRYGILLIFLAAAVYCALSVGRVKVNSDLTAFLPADTETRRGLTIMQEEFVTYPSQNVMIANVTAERARELCGQIEALDGVGSVAFDETSAHYTRASALLTIAFSGPDGDSAVERAREQIDALLAPYDTYPTLLASGLFWI